MLFRLLENIHGEGYCLLKTKEHSEEAIDPQATTPLSTKLYVLRGMSRFWENVLKFSGPFVGHCFKWQIKQRARQIEVVLKKEGCVVIVACSGDLFDIPAAAVAAKNMGIKFIPYFFDDYIYQWTGWRRKLACKFEPLAMSVAAGSFVPNEYLSREYHNRYGIDCQIIRNPISDLKSSYTGNNRKKNKAQIVYTGAVYHAHYDAFINLVYVLEHEMVDAELTIFTAQSAKELENHGIAGRFVHINEHVDQLEAVRIQREADILFLPLAFESQIQEVIRSSAPGKIGEYLISGTPILVHAPSDSYVTWFFNKYGCGVVVDSLDPSLLADSLRNIYDKKFAVEKMTVIASRIGHQEFSRKLQQKRFLSYIDRC